MVVSLLVIAAHTALLHVLFIKTTRLLRFRPFPPIDHLSPAEATHRAKVANLIRAAGTMLSWPLLTVGWFLLFDALERLAGDPEGSVAVMRASLAAQFVAPGIAGFILCGPVGYLVTRLCLGRRYPEYAACEDLIHRHNERRWMYLCFVWVVPLCVEWEAHWRGAETAFYEDRMEVRPVWSFFAEERPYTEVAAVYGLPSVSNRPGQFMPDPQFLIAFRDGGRWTNAFAGRFPQPEDRAVIDLVARQSGRPIIGVAQLP
jgi:hypothetical protein